MKGMFFVLILLLNNSIFGSEKLRSIIIENNSEIVKLVGYFSEDDLSNCVDFQSRNGEQKNIIGTCTYQDNGNFFSVNLTEDNYGQSYPIIKIVTLSREL